MEDLEIIALYLARDEEAIKETAHKYDAYCTAIAMNILKSRADAEECVSDTYLRTWNSIPPQRPASLRLFLASIVRRLSIDRWRSWHSGKRNRDLEVSLEELQTCLPAETNAYAGVTNCINEYLLTLGRTDRVMFIQRYWYNLTSEQVGRELDMSAGAVHTRLHRIREGLQVYLEERGYNI